MPVAKLCASITLTGSPSGSHPREDELDFRSFAGFAIEIEPTTQTIHDIAVYDMQAKASAALVAACCKERIERLAPDIRSHRAAIGSPQKADSFGGQVIVGDQRTPVGASAGIVPQLCRPQPVVELCAKLVTWSAVR